VAARDIIAPGFISGGDVSFIVTRGFGSSEFSDNKGWIMESVFARYTPGGMRRYSVADAPGASSNKGWSFESLQAMITKGGIRRK